MRKEVPEIGWGDFTILPTRTPEVLAIRYDWRNNSVLVLHNLSAIPREVWLEVGAEDSGCLVNLLSGETALPMRPASIACCSIPTDTVGSGSGGPDYILKRSPI